MRMCSRDSNHCPTNLCIWLLHRRPIGGCATMAWMGSSASEASLGEHIEVMVSTVFGSVAHSSPRWLRLAEPRRIAMRQRQTADAADAKAAAVKTTAHSGTSRAPRWVDTSSRNLPRPAAIALQEDRWYIRARNIWGKPNAMPDSSGRYPLRSPSRKCSC